MEAHYRKIAAYFAGRQAVVAVYHHGSRFKGTFRQDSDFDIAILLEYGASLTSLERLAIGCDLESMVPFKFDLSVIDTTNLVLAKEVVAKGRCVFCASRKKRSCFEMLVFSMYAQLQYDRREVLREYILG